MSQEEPPAGRPTRAKLWGGRFEAATDPLVERFTRLHPFRPGARALRHPGSLAHARMLASRRAAQRRRRPGDRTGASRRSRGEVEAGTLPDRPRARRHPHERRGAACASRSAPPPAASTPGAAATIRSRRTWRSTCATPPRRAARPARAAAGAASRAPASTSTRCCPATRTCSARSRCGSPTTGSPSSRCSARDGARFRDLGAAAARVAARRGSARRHHAAARPRGNRPRARLRGARRATAWTPSRSRDAALEFLAAAAIAMVHLSRLAEELVLWSTAEFGFIELADAYATGSSLMPQKKNPDVPELVRGKSGRAIGNLVALLTVLKGLPLTYNRDLQEDKEPIFDSAAHAARLARGDGRRDRHAARATRRACAQAASDPMLLATDLAEALVRAGVPFREAHEAVGRIVKHCVAKDLDLRALSREDLRAFHPAFPAARGGARRPRARARRARAARRHGAGRVSRLRSIAPRRELARASSRRSTPRRGMRSARRRARVSRSARSPGCALACGRYGPAAPSAHRPAPADAERRRSRTPRCRDDALARVHEDARRRQRLRRARRHPRRAPRRSSRSRRACATATSASAPISCWSCVPRAAPTSACRSSTPTARRWRCAPTASAPSSSTCASTVTRTRTRFASRRSAAS